MKIVYFFLLLGALFSLPAQAQHSNNDHNQSRQALLSGEVMPLRDILAKLEQQQLGQVLEVELEQHKKRWFYEIKLLNDDGAIIKLLVDAKTADIIKRRQKTAED